ncbi:hypothetical protein LBMAG53_32810 [Planctomycetota bacterium]|nr:hypothetical protein LBMAG53_32810 [Planctomycetota bacterium]
MTMNPRCLAILAWFLVSYLTPVGAADADALRIAYPSGINGQLAKVIEKAAYAEKHGFAPTFTFFQYGPPMIEALAAGQVDVLFTSLTPVSNFLTKVPDGLTIVADVGKAAHAIVVPGDSPAKTLADLKGKKIAVSLNTELHVDVIRSIKELGLDPVKDFELVNIQPQELASTFEQRLTDAVDIRVPPLIALTTKKNARIVKQWPWQVLVVARTAWLKEHSGAAARLREALKDGIVHIATKPDEAAAWWGEHLRLDPVVVKASADLNPLYKTIKRDDLDLVPNAAFKEFADGWVKSLVEYGIIKKSVSFLYE